MSADLPEELLGIDDVALDDDAEITDQGPDEEPEERERLLLFEVGGQLYAIEIQSVRSIVEVDEYTRVPRTDDAIDGLMDMRGEIAAVINTRVHLQAEEPEPPRETQRVIVFDRPGDEQTVGIRVDSVRGVETVPVGNIVPPTEVTSQHVAAAVEIDGEDDPVPVIDIEGLIQASRQRA